MEIYIVQPGDDINTIANKYGVSTETIIRDNELENENKLVPGQTLVIAYPKQTYIVQEGDSLNSIADAFNVTTFQILKNNPYLSERKYIYPGETIIISYHTEGQIITNGYVYPYVKRSTLIKTLPNLTYLTVFNYRATENGDIIAYYDDTEVIQTAKDYGVAPLMMTTTLTQWGQPNIEIAFNILLSEENQNNHINNIMNVLRTKGYYGVNMVFNYVNRTNQLFYENFIIKAANQVHSEGYLFFVTFNSNVKNVNNEAVFEKIDYSRISQVADNLIFMQFNWGTEYGPPEPISNINNIQALSEYVITTSPPNKITIGTPVFGYDWELPYMPGVSKAYFLTVDSALSLAYDVGATIQFDENSQTPYFIYSIMSAGAPVQHIVWSIDARSINAIISLVKENNLAGVGIWNVMVFYAQLWLVINSQYEIVKVLP